MNQMQFRQVGEREQALAKYRVARINIVMMLAFTLVNILLLFLQSDLFFLFSATFPYLAVVFGMTLETTGAMIGGIAIALVTLGIYLLLWIFSKSKYDFMIPLLVLFVLDTLCTVAFYAIAMEISGILDLAFHIWVVYYLVIGVKNGQKLKRLPEQPPMMTQPMAAAAEENADQAAQPTIPNTPILRPADTTVKSRVLAEANALGHHICYRRVKRVNELVIDGNVYAEYEALRERSHALSAVIDGHFFEVGFNGTCSVIAVDGATLVQKMRVI